MITHTGHSLKQIEAAIKKHGSKRAAARALNIPWSTLWDILNEPQVFKKNRTLTTKEVSKPRKGRVKRFILSSAQANTDINKPFLDNLEAYAKFLDAEILISGYTYGVRARTTEVVFHEDIADYITSDQTDIGGKLLFCAEINTNPTATQPLSGLETYTRGKWGVFPHPRVELKSIATMFNKPAKIIMTTGTVTLPNYETRKAGMKAEFHHVIGAVLVEIDGDGDIFARHLIASEEGDFQDLDTVVVGGEVFEGHGEVEAITWGDIHTEMIDENVLEGCWATGGMIDVLRPKYQFFHDVADFTARNHHNIGDAHHRYKMFKNKSDSVRSAFERMVAFLEYSRRDWCDSVVVESNHDLMLRRWLKEADYKNDPINATFFLYCQAAMYEAIDNDDDRFSIFEHVLDVLGHPDATFLREYDSFMICEKDGRGIECALHGHRGANGAKGHINSFAKMGSKANVAHTHSAAIHEGIYQAGTSSKMDLGYNRGGLSSWSHSHIVTYGHGKRVIVTMQGKKWRAQ